MQIIENEKYRSASVEPAGYEKKSGRHHLKLDYRKIPPFDRALLKQMVKSDFVNAKNVSDTINKGLHEKKSFFNVKSHVDLGDQTASRESKVISPAFLPSPPHGKSKDINKVKFTSVQIKKPKKIGKSPDNQIFDAFMTEAKQLKDQIDTKKTEEELAHITTLEKKQEEEVELFVQSRKDALRGQIVETVNRFK
mmetsp:Transcript_28181/g.42661  ORF Transcript_28181/g.42661 Transcript_28181/m.42661 type:complete len:194 (+) Transcript_28181:887-1468(+)|eukprot:CAMPEP_0170507914 /NCGR_PEP_ID=MMETSP0208-20121228/60570_1 /TAXON_ID=197538 /ORGANISM="Strombidium inclinatum, Strain S3" /LENGTH=193 /DNA_ID=CAMNT_0010790465 /DNA_START=873 /DNA_END=1454 /DNA_ORIENTATION=-